MAGNPWRPFGPPPERPLQTRTPLQKGPQNQQYHPHVLMYRAAELFDWLRGLPEGHELAHLCDVYTYTTLISQCGSHQQLRKALELVAEMRGRGISCNVHTYSALMNVCIKVTASPVSMG